MDYGLVMCVSLLSLAFYCYTWILSKIPFQSAEKSRKIPTNLGPRRFKLRPDRFHRVHGWDSPSGGFVATFHCQDRFFLQPRKEEIRSPNLHSLAVSAYPPQTYATYTSGIFQKTDIDVVFTPPFVDHIPRETIGFAHLCQFTLGYMYT